MFRGATGYAVWQGEDTGRVENEVDTFSCCHCNKIVFVPARAAASDCGGWCFQCGKPTCAECAAAGTCTPFLKQIEQMEARDRFLRARELSG